MAASSLTSPTRLVVVNLSDNMEVGLIHAPWEDLRRRTWKMTTRPRTSASSDAATISSTDYSSSSRPGVACVPPRGVDP